MIDSRPNNIIVPSMSQEGSGLLNGPVSVSWDNGAVRDMIIVDAKFHNIKDDRI